MKVLIVEDNTHKLHRITTFLHKEIINIEIETAASFTSGKKKAIENSYDFVILDMSLPTYEKKVGESGGRFRTFGGEEIARKIVKKTESKFLFLTQYKDFSDSTKTLDFQSLKEELLSQFRERCLGFIYYDSTDSAWKNEVKEIIKNV